ncbi:hypothetical protein Droror1_Dr00003513 [Drosera rotundifolia]
MNKMNRSFTLGLNAFTDLTNEEFGASHNGYRRPASSLKSTYFKYENLTDVPASVDWVANGAVTPIKDQGQCGCNGGTPDGAFSYIINSGGLTTEDNYPYTGSQGSCNGNGGQSAATLSNYQDVPAMRMLFNKPLPPPVSVAIDASEVTSNNTPEEFSLVLAAPTLTMPWSSWDMAHR